jgi:hypothetical protein
MAICQTTTLMLEDDNELYNEWTDGNTVYKSTSLKDFQSRTGMDYNSLPMASLWSDKSEDLDYIPPSGSALLDAAFVDNSIGDLDFHGRVRSNKWDIGAVEYVAALDSDDQNNQETEPVKDSSSDGSDSKTSVDEPQNPAEDPLEPVLEEPDQSPETENFPKEIYGNYFDPKWADAEPGLIRDLNYGSINNWPKIKGDTNKIVIRDQKVCSVKDMKGIISWDQSRDKYGTTFIHIRNCEEVYLENLHFLQASPDWRGSHTIFVEDSGKVFLKDSSFHGAVYSYHVRMEGNREVIIDNVEIAGYDYGNGVVRTGGGIFIENGNEGSGGAGGTGLETIRSPNPRDLQWFQITNSYIRNSHSNPDKHNHDGILVHSGSNGLIYSCLFQDWIAFDAALDVSHRRTDEGYNNRIFRIEKNKFVNNQYVKAPGRSNLDNEILFIDNYFYRTTLAMYHKDYTVRFKNCIFNEIFGTRFLATWGLSGKTIFEDSSFIFTDIHSFISEGGIGSPTDHTYVRCRNNIYYIGKMTRWIDGIEVKISTWNEWLNYGLEDGSMLKKASDY